MKHYFAAEHVPNSLPSAFLDNSHLIVAVFDSLAISSFSMEIVLLSLSVPFREKILAPMTVPSTPGGTLSEESRTSPAFSPKYRPEKFFFGAKLIFALWE